jgi:DNA-binding response OmpR family regulator
MAQPATVLILAEVDDADRVALVAACTDAGFSPTVEPSAEVATGKLGQKRFDALVVHMGTPGAALACMRARGKLLRIRVPVLALADAEEDAAFARAYRAGADEVLVLGRSAELTARLLALPKPSIPQPGNARGDAVVADADRTRAEVIERVLRDAGFRVEVVGDGFAARLQAGRPSLKVAVVDASLDDVPPLITQARAKGARCAWVVRARPELVDDLRQKLAKLQRVAVVSAYGPPDDVLFETNRMLEPRDGDGRDGRADSRVLHGTIVRLRWRKDGATSTGYTYNVSPLGLFVRSVVGPVGETVEIEVAPPGSDTKVRLEGRIAWRREFGTTRKEPVPAGFGIQITGGDIDAWAEACPRAPSLRQPMPDEVRPPAPPRITMPVPRKVPSDPRVGIVAPGEVDIQPREPQSSVEEMLASVLSETIPGDDPGATPLSIDGGNVVELKDGEEAASGAASAEIVAAPTPKMTEEKAEDRPTVVPGPAQGESAPQIEAHEIEAHEITSASLGFQDLEEITRPEGEVPNRHQASEDDLFASLGTLDTIPAPSLASVEREAETSERSLAGDTSPRMKAEERLPTAEFTSPPARVAPVSSVPPSAHGSRDSEIRIPTSGLSPAMWVLAAIVLGGAAAFVVVPRRTPGPPPHPSVAKTMPSLASAPEPQMATAAAEPTVSAPTEAPRPSAVAPEVAPSAAPSAPASSAPSPVGAEADRVALASLQKGEGFLYVASPLATNVYVYGLLAGTTNQRITTKCGPRFLRLGTRPGAWQSEGVVQIVKCGALTRVEMAP